MIDLDPVAIKAHAKRLRIKPAVLRAIAVKWDIGFNPDRMSGRPTVGNLRLRTSDVVCWKDAPRQFDITEDQAFCAWRFELDIRDAQVRAARRGR